jgi:hypothetical protein
MTPQEVSSIIEKRFGQASIRNLLDLNQVGQKPAESVLEYAARGSEQLESIFRKKSTTS